MADPVQLYYWPTPNGWKISIALEEMGIPYEVHYVDIGKGEQFTEEFLALSPNNRMPAILDPEGPDGAPISLFESGAILQYLARKSGLFHGTTERERVAVDCWLFWQVGGVGPMAGQAHHFLQYAPNLDPPRDIPYAKARYREEVRRLYGVLDRRLAGNEWVAGDFYSIADMAIWPWASLWERQGQDIEEFPHMKRWLDQCWARPAVRRGRRLGKDLRRDISKDAAARKLLFGKALEAGSGQD